MKTIHVSNKVLHNKNILLNEAISGIASIIMSKLLFCIPNLLMIFHTVTEKEPRFKLYGTNRELFLEVVSNYQRTRDASAGPVCKLMLIFKRRLLMCLQV